MKFILLVISSCISFSLKAQILLENTYDSTFVYRYLNNEGKDNYIRTIDKTSTIYNSDHSVRRVIQHPLRPSKDFFTENIKNDTLLDFVYRNYKTDFDVTISIVNEKGDTILPAFNGTRFTNFELINLKGKGKVLEQFFFDTPLSASTRMIDVKTGKRDSTIFRLGALRPKKLEYLGEILYYAKADGSELTVHDNDLNVVKRMAKQDFPANSSVFSTDISQGLIDKDSLIEVLYSYFVAPNPMFRVVKENGNLIFPETKGRASILGSFLIATYNELNSGNPTTKYVYNFPNFQLVKTVGADWSIHLAKGRNGDKMILSKKDSIEIYDTGWQLLKKMKLPLKNETIRAFFNIAQNTIIDDDKIEFLYSTSSDSNNSIVVANEDGEELLRVSETDNAFISTLQGVKNKLIVYQNSSFSPSVSKTLVYGLSSTSSIVKVEAEQEKIIVFPNPFNDNFNIKFETDLQNKYNFQLFDITGRLVISQKMDTKYENPIDAKALNTGFYILKIQTEKGNIVKHLIKQ